MQEIRQERKVAASVFVPAPESSNASTGLSDFSDALKDAFMFKDVVDSQMWTSADSIAMKYWKFIYRLIKYLLVFGAYAAFAFCFVACLGAYGTSIFFGATVVLFLSYLWLFDNPQPEALTKFEL